MQQRIKTYWGRDGLGWLKAVGVSAVAAAALGVAVSGDRRMQLASLMALDGSVGLPSAANSKPFSSTGRYCL